jgi:antitoxin (DNA-binding transcriptional repressor) of toxin-antitoxin stability system
MKIPATNADTPVTVTRHGQAVGFFVPLRRPSTDDVERLQTAAANFRKAMPLSEDEVEAMLADFDALRRGRPLPSRSAN